MKNKKPTGQTNIRILIADDHPIFIEGLNKLILQRDEFELLGAASNGQELIEMTNNLSPDLIITDLNMPLLSGIEATIEILKQYPSIGILGLSMSCEHIDIVTMMQAGARGYILKSSSHLEIIDAIYSAYNGDIYFCEQTKLIIYKALQRINKLEEYKLSKREIEIIQLICNQDSNKEMGTKLNLSVRTIEWQRKQISLKLKVKNAVGIIIYALEHNLFKLNKRD